MKDVLFLQKLTELLDSQFCAAQDRMEGAGFNRLGTVKNDRRATAKIIRMSEQNMRAPLAEDNETRFLESLNQPVARDLGEAAHAATSTSRSRVSDGGIGWRSAFSPSMYRAMASLMFKRASASVSPWLAQPDKAGTKTENPPSGSGCKTTVHRWTIFSPPLPKAIDKLQIHSPLRGQHNTISLHGNLHQVTDFQAEPLPDLRRKGNLIILPDLRNHGVTSKLKYTMNLRTWRFLIIVSLPL